MPEASYNVGAAAAPENFSDVLHDWMERAPWLALSVVAHALVILILIAIPWEQLEKPPPAGVLHVASLPEAELFEDPPPEETPEILEEPEVVDPTVVDVNLPPEEPNTLADELDVAEGDPLDLARAPFEGRFENDVIGISGNAGGGKYGQRFGKGPGRGKAGGSGGTEPTLRDALEWLVRHQSSDGSWDCDGFDTNCGKLGPNVCDGKGESTHDVGVTGLALLAFLGDGSTTREGPYKEQVARGLAWLKLQQDPDTGLIGERIGHAFLYNHAIATLALCEAYHFSKSPLLKRPAQDAVNFLSTARNPYGAWRYDVPPSGDNDTSVTGWCVLALGSARDAELLVDEQAFQGALAWFDEATDPVTGRCGYDSIGSASSRITRVNDQFPTERGEAMTAVALLGRFFLGQDPDDVPVMARHAELLRARPPVWDPESRGIDLYYWYYASYAMYQMGGSRYWEPWNRAMKAAVVDSQRKDGDERGSWDPQVDPWGFSGGRVYSTALMALCLEVYFRYSRLAR